MKDLFAGLLPEIAAFYTERLQGNPDYAGGYEFLYNPEAACCKETKILLLTINPQEGEQQIMVKEPCQKTHGFWQEGEFKIKAQLWNLFEELRKNLAPHSRESAETFASNQVIASSAVPYRTHDANVITQDMWMFSRYLWGRIWAAWEPRLIIAMGLGAYHFAGSYFGFRYRALPERLCPGTGNNPDNRWIQFEKPDGQRITLAGFPHFSRYPAFPQNYHPDSPACEFLREVCLNSGLARA